MQMDALIIVMNHAFCYDKIEEYYHFIEKQLNSLQKQRYPLLLCSHNFILYPWVKRVGQLCRAPSNCKGVMHPMYFNETLLLDSSKRTYNLIFIFDGAHLHQ